MAVFPVGIGVLTSNYNILRAYGSQNYGRSHKEREQQNARKTRPKKIKLFKKSARSRTNGGDGEG